VGGMKSNRFSVKADRRSPGGPRLESGATIPCRFNNSCCNGCAPLSFETAVLNSNGIVARARRRDPSDCLRQAVSLRSARLRGSFLAASLRMTTGCVRVTPRLRQRRIHSGQTIGKDFRTSAH
jgi:hypothetical protein